MQQNIGYTVKNTTSSPQQYVTFARTNISIQWSNIYLEEPTLAENINIYNMQL